ncbi:MAG: hypothetical protein F6K26_09290 [Moorea sp. SIO2I5]|nr:hypothetical protein [Moorena sp. SIO2I5]
MPVPPRCPFHRERARCPFHRERARCPFHRWPFYLNLEIIPLLSNAPYSLLPTPYSLLP